MAQDESGLPINGNEKRRSADLLPRYFRTVANNKFLTSTIDQMTQPGSIEKVTGFIGRKNAKAFKSTDNYLADISADRENYQLEPSAVVEDNLGNVLLHRDYRDYVNSTKIRNTDNTNHSIMNSQEYYAWSPQITWDKFTNFREYYWLPQGPDPIAVYGNAREVKSTISVNYIDNVDNFAYNFNPDNQNSNTTLTLYRGQEYTFDIVTPNMPFTIRTSKTVEDDTTLYNVGVSAQKVENGKIVFKVDLEAPDYLYYVNENDVEASGLIVIKDIRDNTELDVNNILDKKTYTMQNGYDLSNGMKVKFYGKITPEKYAQGNWYVEGVGQNIKLISEEDVVITADYLLDNATEFDKSGFSTLPFDNATSYASEKDYICINKASLDKNQWSRYNRWTHKDVIQTTATINETSPTLDLNFRATRPIIEFEAGLKLFNNGTSAKQSVDLIDTVTTDVFSEIEGRTGYFVDGVELVTGQRVLFTADPDSFVAGKIYQVTFVNINGSNQISLVETEDTSPLENQTVFIKSGNKFKGKMFYYTGTTWKQSQDKTGTNQAPLFDLYNDQGVALSTLESSTFTGNKIFSYKVGAGANDTELGFPLSYRTIENSGDIVFDFNLLSDTYQYDQLTDVITASTDTALLRKYTAINTFTNDSGWIKANEKSEQWVVDQPTVGPRLNNFVIDMFVNSATLSDLKAKVYLNGERVKEPVYQLVNVNSYKYVRFANDLTAGDKLVIKVFSKANKAQTGYYEFPTNMEKNPMNENVIDFTFGEVLDHVDSIVDNNDEFNGIFPGSSNLRDLGNLSKHGLKFVKHSGPINLALFNLTQKDFDAIAAIRFAGNEYIKFKREFLRIANELGYDGETKQHVDKILDELNNTKTSNDPFFFSDMFPHNTGKLTTHKIDDSSETIFSLARGIDFTVLGNTAVLPYLNGKLLVKDRDYEVTTTGFLSLTVPVVANDILEVYEYESTDGCWVPPTPTKLGLYPKFEPKVMLDDTYISVTPESEGPYKVYGVDEETTMSYKNKLGWFYPLYTSESAAKAADIGYGGSGQAHVHTFAGYNKLFYMPSNTNNHATFDTNQFDEWPSAKPIVQGHDGSKWICFGDYRDHLLLDLERRIYNNLKQPYDENVLDIADFIETTNRETGFGRYKTTSTLISDFNAWLETVGNPDYSTNNVFDRTNGFTFNYSKFADINDKPLPGFWRAIYKDFYNTDRPHSHPWEILGFKIKPTWFDTVYGEAPYTSNNLILWEDMAKGIVREPGQKITYRNKFINLDIINYIPVNDQGELLDPANCGIARYGIDSTYNEPFVFGDEGPIEAAWRNSSHYPFSLMKTWALHQPAQFFGLAFDRSRIARNTAGQLVYTDTSKCIELDKLVFPNSAIDDTRVYTAGIVNYIQGYLAQNETIQFGTYKTNLKNLQNKISAKIGGFTQKDKFRLILDSRTPTNEGNVFVPDENYKIHLVKSVPIDVYSYSGIIIEVVPAGYIVKGYDKERPTFKTFAPIKKNNDPLINIGGTSEPFLTFASGKFYEVGQIVENSGTYFRVKIGHTSSESFNTDNFQKLAELPQEGGAAATFGKFWDQTQIVDVPYGTLYREKQEVVDFIRGYGRYLQTQGFIFERFNQDLEEIENWDLSAKEYLYWTTQNWDSGTILTLSPSAQQIEFVEQYKVVDDIYDNFYDYSLLSSDGKRLLADFATTERDNTNSFGLYVKNTQQGIYSLKIPTVQHEHVVILDNKTVFGDVIYNRPQGYRQERIKVNGYRSDEWNGSFNVPGFIFDDAKIYEWQSYQDYPIGTLVKHKQFYYVTKNAVSGTQYFEDANFVRLNEKPEQGLLPNWDYKAKQFLDFYDLDSDNFDSDQQRLAQHLIGYQNRAYLENIINDDVSQFKFFQGAIQDKGTKNVLTKLFDKLGSASKDSLEFYEEWAIRVGRYGATTGDDQFEIILDEEKYRQEPQKIELVDSIDPQDTTLIYRLTRNDVLTKSVNYNHRPLPTKYFNEANSYTKTAGYVNPNDVSLQLVNYTDITSKLLSEIPANSYIWTALSKEQTTWSVYKHVETPNKITSISDSDTSKFDITLDTTGEYSIGDIVGINDVSDDIDGFYEISNINLNILSLKTTESITAIEETTGYVTKFNNYRLKNIPQANDVIAGNKQFNLDNESNMYTDTIWVDDDDTGKWSVLKNKQVFELKSDIKNTLAGLLDSTQKDFGQDFAVSDNNNLIAISAPKDLNGSVYVFSRPSDNTDFGYLQQIDEQAFLYDQNGGFGTSVAMSDDGIYLAIGSPNASNLKSKLKGEYNSLENYVANDVVLYDEQLWKAKRTIEGDSIQVFPSTSSNQQSLSSVYDAQTSSYPEVIYIARGDYGLGADESTDHILVRAEREQFEGTKAGDRLFLKWNRYTTGNLAGRDPFNSDPVMTEAFLNGEHVIAKKVQKVLQIESSLSVPDVGSIVQTDSGKATVVYRKVNDDNQMAVYIDDINGTFAGEGTLTQNNVTVGDYVTILQTDEEYYNGWWKVDVGSTFNSTELAEIDPQLVVNTIKVEGDLTTPTPTFTNILDVQIQQDITQPTQPSLIGVLSHQEGSTLIDRIDSKWFIRSEAVAGALVQNGDRVKVWLNDIYINGQLQTPTPIGLDFDYINNTNHTVYDVWDGFMDVRLTNFDLQGDPFIPQVGNTITDSASGESAEITYVKRDFGLVRIFFKNKTGTMSVGSDYGTPSNATFIQNDSTLRTIGPINAVHHQNSISGPLIVVDKGVNISIPTTNTLQALEYFLYQSTTVSGVFETALPPSAINLDWLRVYNVPLSAEGTESGFDNEGAFAVYEKKGLIYQLINYYTFPNSENNRRLGNQLKFTQSGSNYRLFVHAKGDGTEVNNGKIYYIDKNANENWSIGSEPLYRGLHRNTGSYTTGEYVKFGEAVYKSKSNIVPGIFNPLLWEQVTIGVDLLGYIPNDTNFSITESTVEQRFLEEVGESFDVSKDGSVLITTARYLNTDDSAVPNTKIVVYRKVDDQYVYSQLIEPSDLTEHFGEDISISDDGKKIAIGASFNSDISRSNGAVYVYVQNGDSFVYKQTIRPQDKTPNTRFGSRLDFDGQTLAISAKGGDIQSLTTFDKVTSFDRGNTTFLTTDNNSGLVSIYESINDSLLYGQDFSYNVDTEDFGSILKVKNNHVYVGLPKQTTITNGIQDRGLVAEFRKPSASTAWDVVRSPVLPANTEKFKGVFLYNVTDNSLVSYIDYIDPIQGKIAGPAEQEISFKTSYDPCRYNVSTDTNIKAESLDYTSTEHVGKIWWDIDSARFINHHQGDITESTNNFNKLFEGTTVDVYEWVESELLPSEWDAQAESESGLSTGISGTSKYGDAVYSKRRKYNSVTGIFTNYYYYWVKNKRTIPAIENRVVSGFDVSRYISDPASLGYKFVAMLGDNRYSLYNCESLIKDKDIALSFNWWTVSNQEQNIHNQYQIITEGLETSIPNTTIEQKWFDSLVGFDINERPVPDINLPNNQKYGALNEPRQSWFVNKTEARKQFIERVNGVLKKNLIVDDFDLTGLTEFDPLPTVATGIFDTTSDTYAEIRFVSIARVKPATLSLEIENGSIVNVLITDPGEGYINPPTYTISDSQGTGAELSINLDAAGKINSVDIINPGKNYSSMANINVRKFAVLVKNDENINGKWSVFQWNGIEYERTLTQSYDVNLYWKYIDWYAPTYNQFTFINNVIESSYQLYGLDDNIGDVTKISNVGTGGWLLLKKIANEDTTDYSVNYSTIGRENGTIEFLDSLYNVASENIAFDGASYDKIFYDTEPVKEMRKVINVIKNDIFVDQLQLHWNELFFAGLKYVFAEQLNVDWAVKTSFVKAKHNVGELDQRITFKNDSLPSYEKYVEEMKPYKTKVREYLSSYEKLETSANTVTDFDLPPVYSELQGKIVPQSVQIVDGEIVSDNSRITEYPAKHWADNVGYEIKEIAIADAGSGYNIAPVIQITGGGGTGAKAEAFIGNGKLTSVKVTNTGSGYLSSPTIEIIGSIEEGGTPARLSAIFGNGKSKSSSIRVKFDRVTGAYLFQTLSETETFTSTVDQLQQDLKWPLQLKSTNISVALDGLELLRSEYTFENVIDSSKGFTRNFGRIKFTTALAVGQEISVTYNKSPDLLQAQDRINLYYDPTTGQYGNDLGQLLDGIDYGGVEVSSFDFGSGTGWDSDAWFTTTYDTFDTTFEDEIFQLDGSTEVFELSAPLENGVEYNIYLNGVRIDDPNFGTDSQTNDNAVLQSLTGDGTTNTVTILMDVQRFVNGDVVVIRKKSSDGAIIPDPTSYDTLLSGGNLAFSTAKGISPEEIIIDGDGFVTPTTSKGPEEQVPGQVLDSVDIKVYHRPQEGGSLLSSNSYRADGSQDTFAFGIQPQNEDGLIVTVNSIIQSKTQFTVDYKNKKIKLSSVPSLGTEVNVVSISGNGENILEQGEIIGDGSTIQYVTKARFNNDLDYIATVNGVEVESVLVTSPDDDSTDDADPKATILFGTAPPDNSVINYSIYSKTDSFSKIETTEFTGDGSTKVFTLAKTPYSAKPNSHNVIVKQGNRILNPGYNQQFDVTSEREYYLRIWQSPVGSFDSSDILVLLNGVELTIAVQYNIRPSNSSVILEPGIGKPGDVLEVYLRTDGEYAFGSVQTINNQDTWVDSGADIQLKTAPAEGEKFTVYTFNNHDSMNFERINYDVVSRTVLNVASEDFKEFKRLQGGLIKLRYTAIDAQYVWLIIDGVLQTPSVDYILSDDRNYLRYKTSFDDNSVVEIIQFSSLGPVTPKFGFSQFKDILNRNIYKRLGDKAPLKLAVDLEITDKQIVLEDASTLSAPDKNSAIPGIIFVNGERIEYLIKQGNVLRQIQRSTLGTGAKTLHLAGSDVYNADTTQTAPYKDKTIIDEITGDNSTQVFELGFTPNSVNEFEVFVGGRRLRKNAIQVFDSTRDQDSPEADVTSPPEFSVDGNTPFVTLLNKPGDGVKIQIVRRTGILWTQPGESLNDAETLVARFFKAEKVELPK